MTDHSLEMPYIAVIPYKIMIDKTLQPNAKLHYGCLAGLSQKEGYCWASDESLAQMHGVNISQIKRWHKALEEKGYITRKTGNKPYRTESNKLLWKKERKIFVSAGFSNNVCERGENAPINERGENAPIDERRKNAPYKEKSLKEKSIREKEGSLSAPHTPPSSSKKIERTLNVSTTTEEHDKLEAAHGKDKTKLLYERLSLWKSDTPKSKWKRSDYHAIGRWVVDAVKEDALKEEKRKKSGEAEDNITYAKRLEENFNPIRGPQVGARIEAQASQIIIYSTHPTATIQPFALKYKENGFKEQMKQALTKWKLT